MIGFAAQKRTALMDTAGTDVLAYVTFPTHHRSKLHSNHPLERPNGDLKRRTEPVGSPANDSPKNVQPNRASFEFGMPCDACGAGRFP